MGNGISMNGPRQSWNCFVLYGRKVSISGIDKNEERWHYSSIVDGEEASLNVLKRFFSTKDDIRASAPDSHAPICDWQWLNHFGKCFFCFVTFAWWLNSRHDWLALALGLVFLVFALWATNRASFRRTLRIFALIPNWKLKGAHTKQSRHSQSHEFIWAERY
jgi:hypothetical protein